MAIRIWWVTLFLLIASIAMGQTPSLISNIELRGVTNVNKEQIEAVMRTKVGQPYVQSQLDADKRAIENLGFFSAVDVRASEQGNNNWVIIVEVVEFARIKEIRIVGNSVVSAEDITKALENNSGFPLKVGNVFNLRAIRPAIEEIRKLYQTKNFFADVNALGPQEGSPETLNVEIIETVVNSVSVQGATRTKKSVFDKIIQTNPGEAFNADTWRKDLSRLWGTQWFEKVESVIRQTDEIGRIDLIADVKETQTGMLNFGVQVDPRSSFAGLLKYQDLNFRGSGQSYGINLVQGSRGGTSIDLDYNNPFVDDKETSLSVSLYSRVLFRFTNTGIFGGGGSGTPTEDDRFFERRTGASVGISRRLRPGLFTAIGLKGESIRTSDIEATSNQGFIQQDGDVATLAFSLTRDRRDVPLEASRGDWARIALEPGFSNITKVGGTNPDPDIKGQNSFVRLSAEYRTYWSPQGPRPLDKPDTPRNVFAFRGRVGSISGKVPFFEQFFVGGSDSLRGYQEDRFWGRQSANFTLEYRQPIQKAFNIILFADYGGAWDGYGTVNSYTQSRNADFKLGYGAGFGFRTPLGPIRLDFGFDENGKSRTHFLIGTSF